MATTEKLTYKVKDISLAEWGRKEIQLAEAEMFKNDAIQQISEIKTRLEALR